MSTPQPYRIAITLDKAVHSELMTLAKEAHLPPATLARVFLTQRVRDAFEADIAAKAAEGAVESDKPGMAGLRSARFTKPTGKPRKAGKR